MATGNNQNNGNDLLKQIVQEEVARQMALANSSTNSDVTTTMTTLENPRSNIQSIVQRARNLIRSNSSTRTQSPTVQSNAPKRRKISSRSYLVPSKKEAPPPELKTFELVLLRSYSDDLVIEGTVPDYNKSNDDIFCTGMIDIPTNADEISIRSSIQEVLINRLPNIQPEDFDFVKVRGKKITTPIFKVGQDIGYRQVKTLVGQGALYVRLRSKDVLNEDDPSHSEADVKDPDVVIVSPIASPEQTASSGATDLQQLQQMFPNHLASYLEDVLSDSLSIHDAISTILSGQVVQAPDTEHKKVNTLKDTLQSHCSQVSIETFFTTIDREHLWRMALIMYKTMSKEVLQKSFHVDFTNELGIDAGGPKIEFFEELLRIINGELFEGNENNRIPRNNWDKVMLLNLAGIMVAHSIVQKGPAFPVLAPYVSVYLTTGDKTLSAGYLTPADLPHNPQHSVLQEFTNELKNASNQDDMDRILDNNEYTLVIDRSGWQTGRVLTIKNKQEFIDQLLAEELISKRISALENFKTGLNHFGLLDSLCGNVDFGNKLFTTPEDEYDGLPATKVMRCFGKASPKDAKEEKAYQNLQSFILRNEEEREDIPALGGATLVLRLLLKFVTSATRVPPLGFDRPIAVEFLPESQSLPDADTCFKRLKIPICHSTFSEFSKHMLIVLRHASSGFGQT